MVDFDLILGKAMESQSLKFSKFSALLGLCLVFVPLCLTQCTHKETKEEDSAEALYKDAEDALKDEKYMIAIERYRDLKNRFPYSSRATDAELRIADTYFAQESYIEAESAYEIFAELHPTHPKADYVQFRIGLSYFNQIPDVSARDLSAALKSIEAFDKLIARFPNSEFVVKSKEYVVEARKRLADHENYVADFYYRREHYLSASYRYSALLKEFPNLGYDEEALFRLGQSYYNIRMFPNAKEVFTQLLSEFPNTGYKGSVEGLLQELEKKQN
jgi:outer membrane protein assembly factor BamD